METKMKMAAQHGTKMSGTGTKKKTKTIPTSVQMSSKVLFLSQETTTTILILGTTTEMPKALVWTTKNSIRIGGTTTKTGMLLRRHKLLPARHRSRLRPLRC
ncbi:unnamed protein product [Amoebophrya sp. A120]|nr:unnamed protein product [Amoebophrya sp. A120]|eukprot:GSA120T00007150001.1